MSTVAPSRDFAGSSFSRGAPPQPPSAGPGQGRLCFSVQAQNRCVVQTVLVNAAGPRGVRPTRVLIDGGSDASFIRASLAEELGLETVTKGTFACIGFQEKVEEAKEMTR